MIKTIELTGEQQTVSGLERNNTLVVNNSDAPVFASNTPGVRAYKDGVMEIPAGARDTVVGTNGTVYVLGSGSGRVELRGVEYVGFKMPSSSSGSGGGGETMAYMPIMYGITGYFTPETLNEDRWRNAVANAQDILLTNAEIADGHLHFPADGFGELKSDVPRVIYAIFKAPTPASGKYGSLLSKGFTAPTLNDNDIAGTGFDFETKPNAHIEISGINIVSTVMALGSDCENYHLYSASYLDMETAIGYCDGAVVDNGSGYSANLQRYSGTIYLNTQNLAGKRFSTPYPSDFIFLAVGAAKHTPEQIKANSEWLVKRYLT